MQALHRTKSNFEITQMSSQVGLRAQAEQCNPMERQRRIALQVVPTNSCIKRISSELGDSEKAIVANEER